jgi:hypothetical protein
MPRKPLDGVTRKTLEAGGQAIFSAWPPGSRRGRGVRGAGPLQISPGNGRKKGPKMAFRKRVFSYLDNTETTLMLENAVKPLMCMG